MRIALLGVALVALPLFASASARADALGPPPTDCPEGTIGRSSRGGPYCAPTACSDAEPCPTEPHCPVSAWPCPSPEPWRCEAEPRGLCVRDEVARGVRPGPSGGVPWETSFTRALGPCASPDDCEAGARCEVARRCVHAPGAAPTPPVAPPPVAPSPVAPTPAVVTPVQPLTPVTPANAPVASPRAASCACSAPGDGSARPPGIAAGLLGLAACASLALRRRQPRARIQLRT